MDLRYLPKSRRIWPNIISSFDWIHGGGIDCRLIASESELCLIPLYVVTLFACY